MRPGARAGTHLPSVPGAVAIHVALQDEGGRDLVDDPASLATAQRRLFQCAIRGDGRESLVPGFHGNAEMISQCGCEGTDFFSLGSHGAIHVDGKAHDEALRRILGEHVLELTEIRRERRAPDHGEGLGRETEPVGDGNADGGVADI